MEHEDPLAPSRGCMWGLLLGIVLWLVIILFIIAVWRVSVA